jgi:hypothetical protein
MSIYQNIYEIADKEIQVINDLFADTFSELGEHLESYDEINNVYNRLIIEGYIFEHEKRNMGNLLIEHLLITRLNGYLIYIIGATHNVAINISNKTNCRW